MLWTDSPKSGRKFEQSQPTKKNLHSQIVAEREYTKPNVSLVY